MTKNDNRINNKWMIEFWKSVHKKTLIPYVIFGIFLITAIAILGEEIGHHITLIERWISSLGLFGVVIYVFLFVLMTSVFFPDTIMGILAGSLFGLKIGSVAAFTGFLIGSTFQYWLSHYLIKDRIQQMIASKKNLIAIQKSVIQQEFRMQILLRLTPISPALMSYLLGVTGVRFFGFLLICIVHFPVFFLEVYVGYAGRHIARIAGRSELFLVMHDVSVIGGLIAAVIAVYLLSRMARKAIEKTISTEIENL